VPEPLRDIDQAAEFLNIPRTTLRDMVTAHLVPHTRIGRHVRFSEEHLARIVAEGERQPVTVPTLLQVQAARVGVGRTHPPSGPNTPPPPSGPKTGDKAA
jgi:excisionase family DNA binding protein